MIKLVDILKEEIDLDKYVEDWLGNGGAHDNPSINRTFVLKLKQWICVKKKLKRVIFLEL